MGECPQDQGLLVSRAHNAPWIDSWTPDPYSPCHLLPMDFFDSLLHGYPVTSASHPPGSSVSPSVYSVPPSQSSCHLSANSLPGSCFWLHCGPDCISQPYRRTTGSVSSNPFFSLHLAMTLAIALWDAAMGPCFSNPYCLCWFYGHHIHM